MKKIATLNFTLLTLFFLLTCSVSDAQNFRNGDFENNSAGVDRINLNNGAFNGYMANTFGFGNWNGGGPGGGNLDIVQSATYGIGPQSGTWYIAFTGGGTDAVTMELTSPVVAGNTYTITYYDTRWATFTAPPGQIGVTNVQGTWGTTAWTDVSAVISGVWTLKTATFVAPQTGNFISFQTQAPWSGGVWTKTDNFNFSTPLPVQDLALAADWEDQDLVRVNWEVTATGDLPATYVERSENGTDFVQVGFSAPTEVGDNHYTYTLLDRPSPGSSHYYRIRMEDVNGATSYSQSVEVMAANEIENVTVFPNPVAGGRLYLSVPGSILTEAWEISIFNLQGEKVALHNGSSLRATETIDVSDLSAGMYLVEFLSQGESKSFKIVIE